MILLQIIYLMVWIKSFHSREACHRPVVPNISPKTEELSMRDDFGITHHLLICVDHRNAHYCKQTLGVLVR